MKKLLILLIVLFATLDNYGQFTIGPKVGYSASKLSTDFDSIVESVKHNFQVGAFVRFGKKLYLQPEFYYSTSGGTLKIEGKDLQETIKMNNLGVPVLLGYSLINTKVLKFRIMAGPVANFILNKTITASDLIEDPIMESDIKKIAWGLDLGAGVDVFFLALDVRYEFGLNNIYDPQNGNNIKTMNSNMWIVSLGFKIL